MNTTYTYNRAHDDAHLLARRHERDLQWAKERRRQHERELGEARLLLATKPVALAAKTITVTVLVLLAIAGADWFVQSVQPPRRVDAHHPVRGAGPGRRRSRGALVSLRRLSARRSAAVPFWPRIPRGSPTRSTTSARACTRSSTPRSMCTTRARSTWSETSRRRPSVALERGVPTRRVRWTMDGVSGPLAAGSSGQRRRRTTATPAPITARAAAPMNSQENPDDRATAVVPPAALTPAVRPRRWNPGSRGRARRRPADSCSPGRWRAPSRPPRCRRPRAGSLS